ncbi:MAG: LamG domain-containing protein [Planctomycetes bacterium]|nr:LamG domain-containing protein [Planctomycetota bacterium]
MIRHVAPLLLVCAVAAQNTGCTFDPNVDGYLEVPHSAWVVPRSGITVEAWFTYDDATLPTGWRYPTIVRQGIGPQGENIMLRVDADNSAQRELRWRIKTVSGATFDANYYFAPGEFVTWTHVAATYDGAAVSLYINGALVASTPANGEPIRDAVDVLRIGKGSDVATPIEVWNGELDEVRLWPFARTAEDISNAMNLELSSIPGYVSTWNLNNDFLDSSSTQHAIAGGTVVFNANPLVLTPAPIAFGLPQGASTPGCLGDLRLCPSGPAVGNANDYRLVCTRTDPNAFVFWGASAAALPGPLPLLGVGVWLDPTGLVVVGLNADGLGSASLALPIPGGIAGYTFAAQCLVLDACGPQGFTASDALTIVVQ